MFGQVEKPMTRDPFKYMAEQMTQLFKNLDVLSSLVQTDLGGLEAWFKPLASFIQGISTSQEQR